MKKNNLIRKVKQGAAGLLTAAMVLTGAPLGSFTSQAALTLQSNYQLFTNAPSSGTAGSTTPFRGIPVVKVGNETYGGSQGTAFVFGTATTGTNQYGSSAGVSFPAGYKSFNIGAILIPGSENTSSHKGYDGSITSAYSGQSNWWTTYYGFGKTAEDTDPAHAAYPVISPTVTSWTSGGLRPSVATLPSIGNMGVFKAGNDGEVVEVDVPSTYKTAAGGTGTGTDKIEVRMEVKPTPDEQKILVTWTGYNPNSYPVNFWIGAEADTMIAGTDTSPSVVSSNKTHLHMMDYFNQGGGNSWSTRGGSDPAAANPAAGVTGLVTGANAKALTDFDARLVSGKGRVWAGEYAETADLSHRNWVFSENSRDNILVQQTDAAAGFSGNLDMAAHGMASVSFEVSMRAAVYYVDPQYTGNDSNGYIAQPFKDIGTAVKAMELAKVKKGYIYVANPTEVASTIEIPKDMDIQIESSPYNTRLFKGKLAQGYFDLGGDPEQSTVQTIKRAHNFKGAMFKVSKSTSLLSFYNITLDGNKSATPEFDAYAPIIDISAGEVKLTDNTTVQNNRVSKQEIAGITQTPKASAIYVSGNGVLTMNGLTKPVKVIDNDSLSVDDDVSVSAINVTSGANATTAALSGVDDVRARAVNVAGDVTVKDNKDKHTVEVKVPVSATVPTTPLPANITLTTTTDGTSTDHTVTNVITDVYENTSTNPATKIVTVTKTIVKSDANMALGTSMLNVEVGKTFTGTIGVSVSDVPQTNDDQDGRPVIDYADRSDPRKAIPYSPSNILSDVDGITLGMGDSSKKVTDTAGAKIASAPQNQKVLYLRSVKYDYTVSYIDPDGNTMKIADLTLGGTNTIPGTRTTNAYAYAFRAAPGSKVEIPMPSYTGYTFDSASGAVAPLTVVATDPVAPSVTPTKGTVTGKTPAQPVDIVIHFARNQVVYKFDSQGGTPIADSIGNVGTSTGLGTMPEPAKAGYTFAGWQEYTEDTPTPTGGHDNAYDAGIDHTVGSTYPSTGANYPTSATPKTFKFFAKWTPDGTLYPITTYHKNTNAALSLTFGSEVDPGYVITSVVDKNPINVPGYKYGSGSATPVFAGTITPNPSPTPGVQAGHYHIASMPASAVTLNYRYTVDPNTTFTFKVRHVDTAGNVLPGTTVLTSNRIAEQSISAMPDNSIAGYTYSTYHITQGASDGAANSYVLGLNHTETVGGTTTTPYIVTNDPTTGTFVAFMPNQDVTIDYVYTADAGMNLVRRYFDRVSNKIITSQIDPSTPSASVNASIPAAGTTDGDKLYGYVWDASSSVTLDPAGSLTVGAGGTLTGTMPLSGNGIRADYKLSRDASKWRDINFAVAATPNNNGSINPLPVGAPTSFLANDGSAAGNANAYTFDKLKTEGYVPDITPNRYYKFDGWYKDAAATQQVNGTDTFPTGTAPLTLYAKFVEDPSQWFDINFAAGSNGSISAPATLHVPYDYTWNQIASQLPTATPVANYIFNGWNDPNGTHMQATSTLTNHATYTAIFSQDPNTWGTNTGNITPTGRIGNDGSGEIVIDGTTPGNVYVISDPNGNIVAVVPGDSVGNRTVVPNLIPGAHYNVQEGTPDTHATVGQPISSITGTSVSTPKDVYVPTVDSNYNIGYDPDNDGMAQIVINPADPDADYALIDENGNVVPYPGSDNGWMTPVGNNPSTVTFNNLNPNETYTVVARKKGDSSIPNPLTKLPDGNQIIANPGDMADAPKYVVETKDGSVVSVGTTSVGNDTYDQAKAGETVSIHADPVNANGKNFLYWQVLAGRAVGVSGNITQADYTFTLSNSNIVLKAVYEPTKIAGDDADLTETIRGGSAGEFGLDPNQIPGLANTLTTPLDRSLNSVNGANIEYKVVFNKRDAKTNEKTAVKPVSVSGIDHPDAHTAAYGLDIQLERYVNGRLVNNGIVATASNATVDVIAQLPAEDVDQLDYQLFDVTPDNAGNITPVEVTITTDVANNAGLLKFTGNLQHSYVLVYSKTFKVTFIDNKPVLDNLHLNDTSRNFYKKFKVRRKENVEDSYYSSDYSAVTAYAQNDVANALVTPFEDIYGVQYDYKNWSKKEDKLSVYDTTSPVTKRMVIYAYYSDNRKEVAKARVDLGDTIDIAKDLTGDPYLKAGEVAEINEAIAHALETLRQARDLVAPDGTTYLRQANWAELQQAIDALRAIINKYSKGASDREAARIKRTGGASGGGNSSSGRGSKLLTPGEKSQQSTARNEGSNVRAFVLGVDGAWEINPVTKGWSFVLNGGTPINDMWGMITFDDSTGKKVSRWYYFDGQSTMATGWVYDSKNGNWYYMNTNEGPDLGQMVTGWVKDPKTNKWYYMNDNTGILKTGWHKDPQDGRWYYLNSNGEMLTGWQNIGGKWYYFNTNTPQNTYAWDAAAFKWNYLNNSVRPYGSMYAGEKTPDGYTVDANGAWN